MLFKSLKTVRLQPLPIQRFSSPRAIVEGRKAYRRYGCDFLPFTVLSTKMLSEKFNLLSNQQYGVVVYNENAVIVVKNFFDQLKANRSSSTQAATHLSNRVNYV